MLASLEGTSIINAPRNTNMQRPTSSVGKHFREKHTLILTDLLKNFSFLKKREAPSLNA